MSDAKHVVCPHCDGINRIPVSRAGEGAKCGKCHQPLFTGEPVSLNESRFGRYVQKNDLPLLVDFWAPWCGPCKMMAPAFEAAARQLEPEIRLIKVNTEDSQKLGMQYGIRTIPTLMLIHQGQELARQAGAMDQNGIMQWARRTLAAK